MDLYLKKFLFCFLFILTMHFETQLKYFTPSVFRQEPENLNKSRSWKDSLGYFSLITIISIVICIFV